MDNQRYLLHRLFQGNCMRSKPHCRPQYFVMLGPVVSVRMGMPLVTHKESLPV